MRFERFDAFWVSVQRINGVWYAALHPHSGAVESGKRMVDDYDGKGKTPSKAVRAAFKRIGL